MIICENYKLTAENKNNQLYGYNFAFAQNKYQSN